MKVLLWIYLSLKRRRVSVQVIFVCVVLVSLLCISQLSLNNSSSVFLPDNNTDMRLVTGLLEKSPISGMLFVDVEAATTEKAMHAADIVERQMPQDIARSVRFDAFAMTPDKMLHLLPSFFSPDTEKKITAALSEDNVRACVREARNTLQGMGGAAAVPWIRGDPLHFRDILISHLPSGGSSPFLSFFSRPVSADGRHVLLTFCPSSGALNTSEATAMIRSVSDSVRLQDDDVTLRMSGGPRYTAANARAVEHDIQRIAFLSLAGIALIYALLVRAWGAVWIFLTPLAATAIATAATACVWPVTSGLVLGFGMSLMGLAEDYAVHMHFALRSEENEKLIYQNVLPPLAQGFLLNLSGFAVLLLSSIPAIRQMAFFSVVSLTAGFLIAILLLPFLPGFTTPKNFRVSPVPLGKGRKASFLPSLITCIVLFLTCLLLLTGIRTDFSPRALSADAPFIARDAAQIRKLWHLDSGMNLVLTADSRDEALTMAKHCASILRQNGWRNVVTPSDFLPSEKEAKDNCTRWNRWLKQNNVKLRTLLEEAARKESFRPEAFHPFFEALPYDASPLNADSPVLQELGMKDLLGMTLFEQGGKHIILLSCSPPDKNENAADALRAALPPEYLSHALIFSPRFLETSISQSFRQEKNLFFLAGLFALFLLALILRRPARIMAVCTPPLLSLVAALAALRILDLPLNLASLSALPIVFGLAIDHGVMVTYSLEHGQDEGIGRAVMLSSLTAFMSMGLLAFSEHPALLSMGCVIFAGLAAELAAALRLIPFLYSKAHP